MSMDIKNLKEILSLGLELASAIHKSHLDDGQITLSDLPYFLPVLSMLPKAIEGIELIPAELKDLSREEFEEVRALVIEKLGAMQGIEDRWVSYANAAFKIAQGLMEIIKVHKA